MPEDKYLVSVNGDTVAQSMNLNIALILAKALMYEYYAEEVISVAITRQAELIAKEDSE